MRQNAWDRHYASEKSRLAYPDENLVRLLNSALSATEPVLLTAVDLGCGTGRHLHLLKDMGVGTIIGLDASLPGLVKAKETGSFLFAQCVNACIPIRDSSVDFIVAWGSLHYGHRDDLALTIGEMLRILKPSGRVLATLRTARDTHLRHGRHIGENTWAVDLPDIAGSIVTFYDESEARDTFRAFSSFRLGLSERTPVGSLETVISHWIIEAVV